MLTATPVSAGMPYSPSCHGTVTRRPVTGITGRTRIASLIVASITSSAFGASPRTDSISSSWAAGVRTSRSHAHASWLAVVSWPASTSVISSSRSSSSVSVRRPRCERA